MNNFGGSPDEKLHDAAEFLKAGQKKEARRILREVLSTDRNNLPAWELLWRAAYNTREELICLNHILAIDPNHTSAKRRYAMIRSTDDGSQLSQTSSTVFNPSRTSSNTSSKRSSSRKRRQQATTLLILLGSFLFVMCISITGFALYRGGYIPFGFSSNLTATALAQNSASCQALIDKAIQASDNFCGKTNSNKVCYGNTTIQAELAPDATQRFSQRGDIIAVNELRRLSAAPLNLTNNEWGIAVFKVIANLPRSLPGETVTMVVFGNTTLDKDVGSLESFYFSSELGQITCEKVPFDGMMITSPNGSGVRFMVNGTELTLMGDASLKAYKNGEMEVSLYKGSGKIVSNGQEQYFGAGQKVSVQLGGENGTESISAPSKPQPLSKDELNTACTMTGQYCSQSEITPVSASQAQQDWLSQVTSTPTATRIPSPTDIPTSTGFVLPSLTPSKGPPTSTKPPSRTPTRTVTPNLTFSRTNTPTNTPSRTNTPTNTPSRTNTPTNTPSRTNTPSFTPTNTPSRTNTPSFTPTFTPTFTPSNTPSPTNTPGGPTEPACGSLVTISNQTNGGNSLAMDITNSSGADITITRFFAYWVKSPISQKIDQLFLNGVSIWNTSDVNSPSDIPTESGWKSGANRTILDTATLNFNVQFQDTLQSPGTMYVIFDTPTPCQITRSW